MTAQRYISFTILAIIIFAAIANIVYLWPELTWREKVEICIRYAIGAAALGCIVF